MGMEILKPSSLKTKQPPIIFLKKFLAKSCRLSFLLYVIAYICLVKYGVLCGFVWSSWLFMGVSAAWRCVFWGASVF
jgi:hypothetical protein